MRNKNYMYTCLNLEKILNPFSSEYSKTSYE